MDAHPEDLKDAGNEALRAGDVARAIDCYTKALAAVAADSKKHVYYHNRAIAYMRQRNFTAALDDATSAISESRDFTKAYRTKAGALLELSRLEEAVATLQLALEVDANDAETKKQLALAQARKAAPAAAPPPAAGAGASGGAGAASSRPSSTASSSASSSSSRPATASSSSPPALPLQRAITVGRAAMVLSVLCYLLPLGRLSLSAWTALLLSAAVTRAMLVISNVGVPSFSAEYLQRALLCPWLPLLFTSVAGYFAGPSFLLLAPLAAIDALALGDEVYQLAGQRGMAQVQTALAAAATRGLPLLLGQPPAQVAALRKGEKWRLANERVMALAALVEVYHAISLLVLLPLGGGSGILGTLFTWQLMQLRFPLSVYTQQAFASVDGSIRRLLAHPAVPAAVSGGYDKLATFLRGRVQTLDELQAAAQQQAEAAAAGGGDAGAAGGAAGGLAGLAQRCTVQ